MAAEWNNGNYRDYRVSVRLVRESDSTYEPRRLNSSCAVYQFFDGLDSIDREVFYCVHLDVKNRVLSCEEVSRGTLTDSPVHPREVFKAAILSNAAGLIIAHNHPSGDPIPSDADRATTKRLVDAGRILGIPVLDGLSIGAGTYYSMRDMQEM